MLEALGYVEISGPVGSFEADTYECRHCNRHLYLRSSDPKIVPDLGATCRKCMARICSICLAKECMSFEKKLEIYENRQDLWRKLGIEL